MRLLMSSAMLTCSMPSVPTPRDLSTSRNQLVTLPVAGSVTTLMASSVSHSLRWMPVAAVPSTRTSARPLVEAVPPWTSKETWSPPNSSLMPLAMAAAVSR
jgi:hypothetical protein